MLQIKSFLTVSLLLASIQSFSQTPVGLKTDINGLPFNGYYDPFTYAPALKVSYIYYTESYENGHYYDSQGNLNTGQIIYKNNKILFKRGNAGDGDPIKPGEINNFVIGTDSFLTISNYRLKDKIKTKPEFAQFIAEYNGTTFVKHYQLPTDINPTSVFETYLVKAKDSMVWDAFPNNRYFKEIALKYFSDIPILKDKITRGEYTYDDMMSIIKMAEYYNKYKNSEPIWFDTYWQEIRDKAASQYYARITHVEDTLWTLDYYKDSTLLYSIDYSSFYPNLKNGAFVAYYPDGKVRQIIFYIDDEPVQVLMINPNGKPGMEYLLTQKYPKSSLISLIQKRNDGTGTKRDYLYLPGLGVGQDKANTKKDLKNIPENIIITYDLLTDSAGNNLLDSVSDIRTDIYDNLFQEKYTYHFKDQKLVSSYRLSGSDTIFQNLDSDFKARANSLKERFSAFMNSKQFNDALRVNAQGIVLVDIIIDKKGSVKKWSLLNSVHPEIDMLVNGFLYTVFTQKPGTEFTFKPYKIDGRKEYSEVVIPFDFSIDRFYRPPYDYYYNRFPQFDQQKWMNNIKPGPPAGYPGRF